MNTLRFAAERETARAVADVKAWGYRALEAGEPERSSWVAVESNGAILAWWWIQWNEQLGRDALLHVCVAPAARSRVWNKHVLAGFHWVAELFGCVRLWVMPPEEFSDYLRRLRWDEPKPGLFFLQVR